MTKFVSAPVPGDLADVSSCHRDVRLEAMPGTWRAELWPREPVRSESSDIDVG